MRLQWLWYLQHRVGLQQPLPNRGVVFAGGAGGGVVEQDLLGGLSLACATLPRDQDALVSPLRAQRPVRVIRKGKAEREGEVGHRLDEVLKERGETFQ